MKDVYVNRRSIIRSLGFAGAGTLLANNAQAGFFDWLTGSDGSPEVPSGTPGLTTLEQYKGYSNAYEFGTGKSDPGNKADDWNPGPWTVNIDGTDRTLDQVRGRPFAELQSEDFDFRCVEAWGMRVNYNGFPLSDILQEFGDVSKKYVAFTCVEDESLPGQGRFSSFNWPYTEALTMEEAMHPLCWAVFGNYGEPSKANGAPFRINVPWKYGFKSAKFIVKIECTDEKPPATWNRISQSEYGWYSNVYPEINHPRWSQASHRMITSDGTNRIPTKRYNGYEDQVAHMYPGADMDYR